MRLAPTASRPCAPAWAAPSSPARSAPANMCRARRPAAPLRCSRSPTSARSTLPRTCAKPMSARSTSVTVLRPPLPRCRASGLPAGWRLSAASSTPPRGASARARSSTMRKGDFVPACSRPSASSAHARRARPASASPKRPSSMRATPRASGWRAPATGWRCARSAPAAPMQRPCRRVLAGLALGDQVVTAGAVFIDRAARPD